jgi:hypothetical protein
MSIIDLFYSKAYVTRCNLFCLNFDWKLFSERRVAPDAVRQLPQFRSAYLNTQIITTANLFCNSEIAVIGFSPKLDRKVTSAKVGKGPTHDLKRLKVDHLTASTSAACIKINVHSLELYKVPQLNPGDAAAYGPIDFC